jgi:glyoxylase-like metal-dependent hydrolase (beta-lactamase superfamily II)
VKRIEITRLVVTPFASNCYVVSDTSSDHAVVIDPGGDFDLIIHNIQNHNLTPTNILLTHGHLDHIMAVSMFSERFDLPVYAHQEERLIIESAPQQAQMFGLPAMQVPTVTNWFKDGDILALNGLSFKVIHTPGHSPGGSCFLLENDIFVGDTLFEASIGRTDLPGGNHEQLIRSIRTRLFCLQDDLVVHPGHGETTTLDQEKKYNPFLQGLSP